MIVKLYNTLIFFTFCTAFCFYPACPVQALAPVSDLTNQTRQASVILVNHTKVVVEFMSPEDISGRKPDWYFILEAILKPRRGESREVKETRRRLNKGIQTLLTGRVFALKKKDGRVIVRRQEREATVIGSAIVDLVVPYKNRPFPEFARAEDLVFAETDKVNREIRSLPSGIRSRITPTPGGPGLAEAIVLAQLLGPNEVKMIATLGNDREAGILIRCMKKNKIDTSGIRKVNGKSTARTFIPSDGEITAFVHSIGANDELSSDDIKPEDYKVQIFHIGGIALNPRFMTDPDGLVRTLEKAKEEGAITVMDTVVDRVDGGLWKQLEATGMTGRICRNLDVLTISKKEVAQYTGATDPADIVQYFLDKGIATVIYKMGQEGCMAGSVNSPVFSDTSPVQMPVYKKSGYTVMDGTGMGDAFSAAISASILSGYPLGKAAAFATAVASLAGEQKGGGNIGPEKRKGARERFTEVMSQRDVVKAVVKIDGSASAAGRSKKGYIIRTVSA
ncbi:MAG: carbohydrate kinase family protein [Candidatus Aureabacteria bacterium]|nr:carbohydrate kinase family protein [Candidatus Auribacterota bacterium]